MKPNSKRTTAAATALKNVDQATLRSMIAKKAYELFETRGCRHGRHEEDWLEAQQIVCSQLESVSELGPKPPAPKPSRTVATQRRSARR